MLGGPPQQETFDLKPEAPGSARSLFRPIPTNVPGIEICELLPGLAAQADRFAIVRSVYHGGNALFHGAGVHYNLTGFANFPREGEPFLDRRDSPSLGAVLTALRPHVTGKLHLVFGCGGDRDRAKRPMMGEIACRLADRVIVTDDNPRTEQPATIRIEILVGCPGATEIGDRAAAIRAAIAALQADDLLVVAGKGHEQGQIVGNQVRPFDDAAEVRAAVAAL